MVKFILSKSFSSLISTDLMFRLYIKVRIEWKEEFIKEINPQIYKDTALQNNPVVYEKNSELNISKTIM